MPYPLFTLSSCVAADQTQYDNLCLISSTNISKEFGLIYSSNGQYRLASDFSVLNAVTNQDDVPICPCTRQPINSFVRLKDIPQDLLKDAIIDGNSIVEDNNQLKTLYEKLSAYPDKTIVHMTDKIPLATTSAGLVHVPLITFIAMATGKAHPEFVKKLLKENPDLTHQLIDSSAYFARFMHIHHESFYNLLIECPDLVKYFKKERLFNISTNLLGEDEEFSIFTMFSLSAYGQKILKAIFMQHPEWLESITAENLYGIFKLQEPMYNSDSSSHLSTFMTLCAAGISVNLLQMIFDKQPQLLENMQSENLFSHRIPNSNLDVGQTSAFFFMAINSQYHSFLSMIFEKHPEFIEKLTPDNLSKPLILQTSIGNVSYLPLMMLQTTTDGQKLIYQFFTKNTDLTTKEIIGPLYELIHESDEIKISRLLYYACIAPKQGHKILKLIFEKIPSLVNDVTAESLLTSLPSNCPILPDQNALFGLSGTVQGCEILSLMLLACPEVAKAIDARELILPTRSRTSVFSNLCAHESGHKVLRQLITANPILIIYISTCVDAMQESPDIFDQSFHRGLQKSDIGKSILDVIKQANVEPESPNSGNDEVSEPMSRMKM